MSRRLAIIAIAVSLALSAAVLTPHPALAAGSAPRSWIADNGNGTYSNPLFYEEFEDPDIIRVGEDYYLAGTTMHMNPGLMVMHSRDLVNWELASYCIDRLDLGPAFRLEGGRGIYGQGIWAPCIRYHDDMFYVFSNVNGVGLQVFRSKSANGPWQHNQLPYFHDLSVLFDDDGKIYLVSGNHNPYSIVELNKDCTAVLPDSEFKMNAPDMGEGHHLYKINGKYYDISAIPGGTVDQMVARADSIKGPWTVERMVQLESLGVPTRAPLASGGPGPNDRGLTLHQGGMCDTPSGEWWSVIMQDHGSIGRMVALVPITWEKGFPLIGLPGNLRKAPNTWVKPNTGGRQEPKPAFLHDDDFDGPKFKASWQWNHVPDDSKWSLTEKPGVLRLHSLPAADFYGARNTLCQRPLGPECTCTVELEVANLVTSDTAGLALLSVPYAWIGVVKTAGGPKLQMVDNTGNNPRRGFGMRRGNFGAGNPQLHRGNAARPATPAVRRVTTCPVPPPSHLWLRVACNFDTDQAIFSWSADGREFTRLGNPFTMTFQLTTFQGVRPGLFCYNTSDQPGGYADFDNFTMDAPRVAGTEREIPSGKTIVLTSGADGSTLAADTQKNSLVNVAADASGAVPQNARFQVVDLGLGRVALKAAGGKLVSVGESGVILKDLAGAKPGEAETFQWVNLMRGDTMLMSLTNHRYLATQPNSPGAVTVSATGPRPDRKSGAEFKWKAVEAAQDQPAAPSAAAADAPKLPFATPLHWKSSGILIKPAPDATHNVIALKDPTVVHANNMWHVFATTAHSPRTNWSMCYLSFKDWSEAANAKPYYLDNNPNLRGYHCAPQVFYFRPQKKWYLIYQSQPPQYSTTDDISKPESWSKPQSFFPNQPKSAARLWIDFSVICDDTHAYLFSSGDNGRFYRSRTRIEDFPKGMSDPEVVISGPRNDVFEASMTYRIKGTGTYLTLIEAMGPARYYRAWTANRLDGEWTPVPDATTWQKPFAGINNVSFEDGVTPWTRDISHGELIRDGYDETMTIDPNHLQMLFQGRDPSVNPRDYGQLPYRLGLLKLDRSGK